MGHPRRLDLLLWRCAVQAIEEVGRMVVSGVLWDNLSLGVWGSVSGGACQLVGS